jgi:hypothetical protein
MYKQTDRLVDGLAPVKGKEVPAGVVIDSDDEVVQPSPTELPLPSASSSSSSSSTMSSSSSPSAVSSSAKGPSFRVKHDATKKLYAVMKVGSHQVCQVTYGRQRLQSVVERAAKATADALLQGQLEVANAKSFMLSRCND